MIHKLLLICSLSTILSTLNGQDNMLTFREYLAYVKMYHPLVKQANLIIDEAELKLLKARGAVDPKLEVDFDRKRFKETAYYNKLNTAFKIPTWYGIDFKVNYQLNDGKYLNPENNVPNEGIFAFGVTIPVIRNMLFSERMVALKQAKIYQNQSALKNKLAVNELFTQAITVYFEWIKAYRLRQIYQEAVDNVDLRLAAVRKSVKLGDKPAIDTTEVRIALNNRKLEFEKSKLYYTKALLKLSNFLWVEGVPVELNEEMLPDLDTKLIVDEILTINAISFQVEDHPKMLLYDTKIKGLQLERKLNESLFFPQIKLQYNFLNSNLLNSSYYDIGNYKAGVSVSSPIFYRKQRAALKLNDLKIESTQYEREAMKIKLKNKRIAIQEEMNTLKNQLQLVKSMVQDYQLLVNGEEKKFAYGEGSIFMINYREVKLIETKVKAAKLENKLLLAKGKLYNLLVN